MPNQFWNIKNTSEDSGELTIYGDIGESWWGDSVSSKKFDQGLMNLGNITNLVVRINSGGGDVFTGHHIYAALKDHPAKVTVKIEGLAASAASVIAMAADEIIMHSSDFMMIHNPAASTSGEAKDFAKMVGILGTIKEGIINAYAAKTGRDKKEISDLMDAEKWMTGEEAVNEGFADRLDTDLISNSMKPILNGNILVVNGLSHDLTNLKSRPNIKNELEVKESSSFSFLDKILNIFKDNNQVEGLVNNILENNLPNSKQIENQKGADVEMDIKNVEDLKKNYPDLMNQAIKTEVDAAVANAIEVAVKNERARFQEIEQIAKNISPELVNKAKYEEPIDAKDLAFIAMQTDGNKGQEYLDNLKNDTEKSGAKEVKGSTTDKKTKEDEESEADALFDNAASKINARRGK